MTRCGTVQAEVWKTRSVAAATFDIAPCRQLSSRLLLLIIDLFRRRFNLMSGIQAHLCSIVRQLGICITITAALSSNLRSAHAVVVISDGFGDADRNNDGAITGYDTDLNDSGTF